MATHGHPQACTTVLHIHWVYASGNRWFILTNLSVFSQPTGPSSPPVWFAIPQSAVIFRIFIPDQFPGCSDWSFPTDHSVTCWIPGCTDWSQSLCSNPYSRHFFCPHTFALPVSTALSMCWSHFAAGGISHQGRPQKYSDLNSIKADWNWSTSECPLNFYCYAKPGVGKNITKVAILRFF